MPGQDYTRPISSGVKLTYDDLLLLPEDRLRHELIDGEHYVTPPPTLGHQGISGNLHWLIRSYLQAHPVGRIVFAPADIVFTQFDVLEPDLLYASNARWAAIATDANLCGAPDLVIEILSPTTAKRDKTLKRDVYERFGVAEYWVVDPKRQWIDVYRRAGERFDPAVRLSHERGDVLVTPLLPGLTITLADVFKD